jgi:probable phosphoglycerate mutase
MDLLLIRHGLPDEASEGRSHETPLNAAGLRQARAVARQLAGERVDRIVSSPMRRAFATAEPSAKALGHPIEVIEGWAEADRDHSRYRSRAALRSASTPEEWEGFMRDPLGFLGVDPAEFQARVLGALGSVLAGGQARRVAVFTHNLVINVVLQHVLRLDRLTHFEVHWGSISRVRGEAIDALRVVSVNETLHLEQ